MANHLCVVLAVRKSCCRLGACAREFKGMDTRDIETVFKWISCALRMWCLGVRGVFFYV
jgi:hypothetical protein